jgi:hypothetical protein
MDFNKKYYYLYKITNNINGHFYYGIHSTNNLNDGYMGSGKRLQDAYVKYGIENFTKEIVQFCNSLEELSNLEKEIVNEELINNPNCYNLSIGGYFLTENDLQKLSKSNKDSQKGEKNSQFGKCWVYKDDTSKSIKKGELEKYLVNGWIKGRKVHFNKEKILESNRDRCWIHKNNDIRFIYKDDLNHYLNLGFKRGKTDKYIYGTKKLQSPQPNYFKGKVKVVDNNNNSFFVSTNDPKYLSGELVPYNKGKISAVDKEGNKYFVSTNDPRYLSGELFRPKRKTINGKISVKDINGNTYMIDKNDPKYLSGELVGVNKGRHWKNKKMSNLRKNMRWVNKDEINTFIKIELVEEYLSKGWKLGRFQKSKK